jgi:pimeloyl-ACP methyl ester carboxylesterase
VKLIYAIPGIGTTKELFQKISVPGHELKVLEWPATQSQYTLKDYAAEFSKQIKTDEPVNLIGVSFGGMLCSELTGLIPTNKVVLISSCSSTAQFPMILRFFRLIPLHKLVPDPFIRFVAKSKRRFLGLERSFESVFVKMIDSMPRGYFYHCAQYIISWNRKTANPGIVQIHGTADRLLSYRHIKNSYAVHKGSHSMVLNKAGEINTILNIEFNGR